MLQTRAYQRKPFVVQAVQVTLANMPSVVQWCKGNLCKDDLHRPYIKVEVHRAASAKQTMAYEGDWVLISATGARVYTDYAFNKSFEPIGDEVDPQKKQQNVFELPGVDRKEVVEKPVGEEKAVQPDSVETRPETDAEFGERAARTFNELHTTALPASQLFRAPEEIREAHRTGVPRTADEIREYREAFKRQHGRYPGEEPGSSPRLTPEEIVGKYSLDGREAYRRLYGVYPEEQHDAGRQRDFYADQLLQHEKWAKDAGHGPAENVDNPDA